MDWVKGDKIIYRYLSCSPDPTLNFHDFFFDQLGQVYKDSYFIRCGLIGQKIRKNSVFVVSELVAGSGEQLNLKKYRARFTNL